MEKLSKIREVQRSVNQFETTFEKKHSIGLNEGMMLCSLRQTPKLSSGELGERLGLSSSNTSKVILSLERKELIERELGTKDKRQMFFLLTKKGRKLLKSIQCEEIEIPRILRRSIEA